MTPLRYDSSDQATMVKIEKFVVPIFFCITQDVSCVKTKMEITPQFRPQQWRKGYKGLPPLDDSLVWQLSTIWEPYWSI